MVVLSRADYERLLRAAEAALEDAEEAADAARANEVLARLRGGHEGTVTLAEARMRPSGPERASS